MGSAYYHWAPDNTHLVWDRLPMTIGFMSLFAALIMERIDRKAGLRLLLPLLIVGVASFELLDRPIYQLTHQLVSGHTLKHLTAALATYLVFYMLIKRKPITLN